MISVRVKTGFSGNRITSFFSFRKNIHYLKTGNFFFSLKTHTYYPSREQFSIYAAHADH